MKSFYFYKNKATSAFILLIMFFFNTTYAIKEQKNNTNTQMLPAMETYCKQMRGIRVELIENSPQINTEYPIHLLADSHCFTQQENLYFAAIKLAQHQLGDPAPWFSEKMKQAKIDSKLECKENNLKNDELAICKQNTLSKKKNNYEAQKIIAIVKYLDNRQKTAKNLFNSCSRSMIDKITLLPQAIQLPLAWHTPTNRSVTDLSFQNNQDDNDWLLSLQYRSYKEDLREILQHQCPGEMIYWISNNQKFDINNLYKRR